MNYPLQPIRVPAGWLVEYNKFCELDPSPPRGERDFWLFKLYFTQDLLQASNKRRGRLLDLGWYPDGDMAAGAFHVVVHVNDFHGELLHSFRSRDRLAVVAEIERLFSEVSDNRL